MCYNAKRYWYISKNNVTVYSVFTYSWVLKVGIQQIDLLIRNKCTRDLSYLSYDQGSCVRNASEGGFNFTLITPPRFTFVNNSVRKFLLAEFRKLLFLCSRALF